MSAAHPFMAADRGLRPILEQVQVHLIGLIPIVIAGPPFETILHVHPRLGVVAQARNIRTP